jgi:iron complex transport system ATP-binding protein
LAQQPQILLLDEPTSSLDVRHQLELLSILRSLAQSKERAVVMTMHDLNLASRFSDKIILLRKGEIYAVGSPEEVLTETNIETVYGIKCKVSSSFLGFLQVMPLASEFDGVRCLKMRPAVTVKHPRRRLRL